jgi:hypothetical protein
MTKLYTEITLAVVMLALIVTVAQADHTVFLPVAHNRLESSQEPTLPATPTPIQPTDTSVPSTPTETPRPGNCHPSYPAPLCITSTPRLNCEDIHYRRFKVLHTVPDPDPHGFDGNDNDGCGCEMTPRPTDIDVFGPN